MNKYLFFILFSLMTFSAFAGGLSQVPSNNKTTINNRFHGERGYYHRHFPQFTCKSFGGDHSNYPVFENEEGIETTIGGVSMTKEVCEKIIEFSNNGIGCGQDTGQNDRFTIHSTIYNDPIIGGYKLGSYNVSLKECIQIAKKTSALATCSPSSYEWFWPVVWSGERYEYIGTETVKLDKCFEILRTRPRR